MPCPPVKEIVRAVETDDMPSDLDVHLESCEACHGILVSLREESEGLTISVGALWVADRISCPHDDILLSFVNGGLGPAEADYITFHLETVGCPHCQAKVAEIEDRLARRDDSERIQRAMDDSMRRSAVFLDGDAPDK